MRKDYSRLMITVSLVASTVAFSGCKEKQDTKVMTQVSSTTLDPLRKLSTVMIRGGGIFFNDRRIVRLKNYEIADSKLQGGAGGILIDGVAAIIPLDVKPTNGVTTYSIEGSRGLSVNILCEPQTPYSLLFGTIASLRSVKPPYTNFYLVVASPKGEPGVLPLFLPEPSYEPHDPTAPNEDEPLKLVASLTEKRLLLWSVSGEEGTLEEPKLTIERNTSKEDPYDLRKLQETLMEISTRRWPKNDRDLRDYELILQADRGIPFSIVAEVVSRTSTTPSGEPLFAPILARPSND